MSSSGNKATYKAVDYATYYFGTTSEEIGEAAAVELVQPAQLAHV